MSNYGKLTWYTSNQRTAGETAGADAHRLMGVHMAEGSASARRIDGARIDATLVLALSVQRTVIVLVALGHRTARRRRLRLGRTLDQRIANVARGA